jgi:hypothetical protein
MAPLVIASLAGGAALLWKNRNALGGGDSPRIRVIKAALGEIGSSNAAKYWASSLPGTNMAGQSWCGAFALWSLHQAGLATDWLWEPGLGFLMATHHNLPRTSDPQPGDIAYFDKYQHEAVIYNTTPTTVLLVNGNGTAGKVSISEVPKSSVTAFFSIEPLIAA